MPFCREDMVLGVRLMVRGTEFTAQQFIDRVQERERCICCLITCLCCYSSS
jgi:hypothetical protein